MDSIANFFGGLWDGFNSMLEEAAGFMSFPLLTIVLILAGLFFTFRTRFVQVRLLGESCKLIMEKPAGDQKVSSFQALMVSTASRVGTGNIIGVSSAICIGGAGACFWMWIMCVLGVYREYSRADFQAEGQERRLLRRSCVLHRKGAEAPYHLGHFLCASYRHIRVRLQYAVLV